MWLRSLVPRALEIALLMQPHRSRFRRITTRCLFIGAALLPAVVSSSSRRLGQPSLETPDQAELAASTAAAAAAGVAAPVNYLKNGADWQQGACASRDYQSPVNFDEHLKDPPLNVLNYHYEPVKSMLMKMQASSGVLHVDTSEKLVGGVMYNEAFYPLVRIDFHAQGEHLFKGVRNPMEIHMVHRKLDDPTKQVIVAIPVWSEATPVPPSAAPPMMYYPPDPAQIDHNYQLQHFLMEQPPSLEGGATSIEIDAFDPLNLNFFMENAARVDSNTYIQYSGSLTMPPCDEHVTWFVRRVTMVASSSQVQAFSDAIYRLTSNHGNTRAVMPMNGRSLRVYRSQYVPVLDIRPKGLMPAGPNPRTDGELQAATMANQAIETSNQAVDYMKDFARRLRKGSRASANELGKSLPTEMPLRKNMTQWDQAVARVRFAVMDAARSTRQSVEGAFKDQASVVYQSAADEAMAAHVMVSGTLPPPASAPAPAPAAASVMGPPSQVAPR